MDEATHRGLSAIIDALGLQTSMLRDIHTAVTKPASPSPVPDLLRLVIKRQETTLTNQKHIADAIESVMTGLERIQDKLGMPTGRS